MSPSFHCLHCRRPVSSGPLGSRHRNHCNYCLWSRHLDSRTPGDRSAACGGQMPPVRITSRPDGEILIVHQCTGCGRLSRNRIAGDDDTAAILAVYDQSPDPLLTREALSSSLFGSS